MDKLTIAVVGVEFGWGSAGKLSAIITELKRTTQQPLRLVLVGSKLGRPVLADLAFDAIHDVNVEDDQALRRVVEDEGVQSALSVLDPTAARAFERLGVPTVFVDSLPFLWTRGDLASLPLDVSVYCAQRSLHLSQATHDLLSEVRHLIWIEPVISPHAASRRNGTAARKAPPRRVLVTLGGLLSPHLQDINAYADLVVPAVLAALTSAGVEEVHVAGNLPSGQAARIAGRSASRTRITQGPLSHSSFLSALNNCDMLLASPGLTTLLEASQRAVATVLLPPQNVSQVLNATFHATAAGGGTCVSWPTSVFNEDDVVLAREAGEGSALDIIYAGITRAARAPQAVTGELQRRIELAMRAAQNVSDWALLHKQLGDQGAAQVADQLLALTLSKPARPEVAPS